VVDVHGLAAGHHARVQLAWPKLFQAPFNAGKLAPVKVMLKGADHGLDIAGNTPQLADRLPARPCVRGRVTPARASVSAIFSA